MKILPNLEIRSLNCRGTKLLSNLGNHFELSDDEDELSRRCFVGCTVVVGCWLLVRGKEKAGVFDYFLVIE
jgi:hypothetical protein